MAEVLDFDQALAALQQLKNPTREQLLDLASRVSVDAPGDVTVLYSGPMGQGAWATPAANTLGNVPGVRVIDNSEAFKFLDSREFKTVLAQLDGVDYRDFVDRNYSSPTTKWLFSATEGPWAQTSARFVSEASGDVRTITPYAMDTRVFAATELPGLMDNPNVTHINGVDKGVYQALLDTGHSLSDVNKAVSASSYGLLHDAKIQFDADGRITGIDPGQLFDGTDVDPPRLNISDADYLQNVDGFFKGNDPVTNASTLDNITDGWRLLGEGATAHNLMTGTIKGMAVLGAVATTYEVYDMADRANKAYAEGDKAGAARILAEGTAHLGGEWAGGVIAAETAATAFAPLLAAGPIGIAAYVLAVGGSGAAGAYAGGEVAEGLIRTIEGAQAISDGRAELVFLPILENDGQISGWRAESTTVDEDGNSYVLSNQFDADGNYARTEMRSYGPDGTYQGTNGVDQATERQIADRIWQVECEQQTGSFCVVVRGGGPNAEVLIESGDETLDGDSEANLPGGSDVNFEGDDDASVTPASGSQIEIDGQTYTLNADGEYVQNLGQGQYDLYDSAGNRYLVDAQGNRTLVAEGDTITFNGDTGLASVAPVFVPPAPPTPQDSATPGLSLGELAAQLPPGQVEGLLLSLANMGLTPEALGGVVIYTNPDGSRLITVDNGDGGQDTIGTMEESLNGSGWSRLKLNGQEDQYLGPDGQVMNTEQYQVASLQTATQGLEFFTSLTALENWSSMTPLQQANTLAGLYNQIDNLGAAFNGGLVGGNLPGNTGTLGSVIGLLNALESGNEQGVLTAGMQLASQGLNLYAGVLADQAFALMDQMLSSTVVDAATAAALDAAAQGANAAAGAAQMLGDAIPYVNLVFALYNIEDNPWGAVAAAAACFPPVGTFVAAVITVVQMFFPADIDPSVGEAEVHIDANGQVVVNTTVDDEGGGSTAAHWAEALAHMAQQAGMSAPQAGAAAQHLPSVGYYFDPDGFNFEGSAGQLVLRWTEADGSERQRVYDSSGMAWDGDSVPGQSDIMRDYLLLCQSLEPNWPPVMYQEVAGGILQLDYGVATVLYATALGSYDNSEAHTHGGEEDSDGGDVLIDDNSFLMYGLDDHTIENSSEQTEQTLGAGEINTVPAPAAMGANPNGPQIPRGRNPIVFVPIGAGGGSVSVTSGMVQSLDANNLFSDAQLAAMALALGAGALPLISHAGEGSTGTLSEGGNSGTYDWGINGSFLANRQAEPFAPPPSPGGWTDANGQTIAPGGTTWPAATGSTGEGGTDGDSALQTPRTETPELISEPAATDTGPGSASALPPGFGAQESGDTSAVLQAGEDLVLDYPTAQADQLQGTEDQSLRFSAQDLLANDSTPNPVPRGSSGDYFNGLRIISVGEATHGQVGILNGELVFIPDPNYNGIATFSYTVQDMYGLTHTGTTSILVQAVNDAPEARGESASGSEDVELLFTAGSLLRNDRDIDGDSLRISRVGEASGGTVFLQPDGSVRFVPTPNYNGPAGYAYWVSDGHEQVRAEVNLSILQVNDLPVVQGELVGSDEDVVLNFPFDVLLANDSDIDTDPTLNQTGVQTLTISAVGNAQHGTVEIVDGQVRFTPDLNYFGPASFDYRVDDGAGGQVSTTVVLNLAPVNDAPDVQGEEAVIAEDNVLIYTQADLLANDSDVDNAHGELRITQVGGAQNGSVELLPDGRIRFIPDADYFGPAQFDYLVDDGAGGQSLATVTLDVTPVNDAPRLQAEQADVDEDTVVTLSAADLLANDHDVDNVHDELRITSVGGATHGTVAMDAQGNITFTPTLNFYGQASFSYTVSDGVGGESTTTMTLDYASVNDLPVVNDELVLGKRDNTYTFTAPALLANDTDVENPAGLQIVAVGGAENGTVTMLPDGRIQFVPAGGYDDWDPAQYGSFEYTVRDPDGGETVGHVDIDYERVNVNPVAVDDAFQGYEDVRMEINVSELLRNDSDPDASGLTSLQVDQVGSASHGTVSLSNGVVTFTPQHDYYGAASFQYRANDGEGGTTWATAHIDLERENRAPVIDSVDILGAAWLGRANATLAYGYFPHWDEGIDPYLVRTEPVSDRTRANGRIYAHDPDGDAVTFTVQFNHKPDHGNVFINYYAPLSTPRYLSSAQLMGAQPTYDWDRYNSGMGSTVQLPGVDPDHLDGANTNYLVRDTSSNGHNAYAAWQYIVTDVTSYTGLDSFTVTATDSRGASTTYTINVQAVGWGNANNGYPPIVVDMNGNGLDLLPPNYSMRTMDVNLDGTPERIGWVAPTDAVLAFDKDEDGLITDPDETSFVSYKPGARTDLEGLVAFDSDGDGRLTASDEQWNQFGLLQDHNNNGVQDEGEWMSLTDQGVESIGLQSEGSLELNNGNVVFGTTTVTFTDGGTTTAGDVMFAAEGVELPDWVQEELAASAAPVDSGVVTQDPVQVSTPTPAQDSTDVATEPSASTTEPAPSIEQQANVFTQTVATQDAPGEPLGFVDANQLDLAPEPDVIIVLNDEPTVSAPSAPAVLVPA